MISSTATYFELLLFFVIVSHHLFLFVLCDNWFSAWGAKSSLQSTKYLNVHLVLLNGCKYGCIYYEMHVLYSYGFGQRAICVLLNPRTKCSDRRSNKTCYQSINVSFIMCLEITCMSFMHEKETWKSMQDFKKLYLLNFGYYFGFLIFPNEVFQLFPSQHLLSRKPY